MADTVVFQSTTLATPPSATIVATDDCGASGQAQITKLAIATNGSATLIPSDATDGLLVNLGANNDVTVASLPLPSGAATEATLSTLNGKVTAVNTGAVVVSSSALPTGASTAAKQPALGTAGTASADVISVQGIASMTPVQIADNGGSITVDGTVTATVSNATISGNVTVVQGTATNLKAEVIGTGTFAVQDAAAEASLSVLDDWDESDRAKVNPIVGQAGVQGGAGASTALTQRIAIATDANVIAGGGTAGSAATGVVTVQGIASMTKLLVTPDANSAVNLAQVGGNTVVTSITGAAGIGGDLAHGDADSTSKPVKVGMKALAHGANPTAVDASDRVDWFANRAGIPWVMGGHPNIITIEAEYTSAQTNTAIVTVSSGAIIVVTQIQATVDEATTVGVGLRVGFAAATTPTTTGVVLTHPGMVPGSGISRGDGGGILGIGADGEDLRITSDAATSGALRILVSYYTIES